MPRMLQTVKDLKTPEELVENAVDALLIRQALRSEATVYGGISETTSFLPQSEGASPPAMREDTTDNTIILAVPSWGVPATGTWGGPTIGTPTMAPAPEMASFPVAVPPMQSFPAAGMVVPGSSFASVPASQSMQIANDQFGGNVRPHPNPMGGQAPSVVMPQSMQIPQGSLRPHPQPMGAPFAAGDPFYAASFAPAMQKAGEPVHFPSPYAGLMGAEQMGGPMQMGAGYMQMELPPGWGSMLPMRPQPNPGGPIPLQAQLVL